MVPSLFVKNFRGKTIGLDQTVNNCSNQLFISSLKIIPLLFCPFLFLNPSPHFVQSAVSSSVPSSTLIADMALPTATTASHPTPQVVGAAFVHQYYHILHNSPDMVHKFYLDSSILSRPDSSGVMTHVTTLQAINDKVLSFKFSNYIAEIETVDSAASYKDGVFIVVTGSLTGNDNVRQKFTQSFFLAPQNKGYFVLNDIFRFVAQNEPVESYQVLANGNNEDVTEAPLTAAPEPGLVQENHVDGLAPLPLDGDLANCHEAVNPSESSGSEVEGESASVSLPVHENEPADASLPVHQTESSVVSVSVHQNKPTVASSTAHQSETNDQPDHNTATTVVNENGPKKSYASIVKVTGNTPSKKSSGPVIKPKAKAASPSTDNALNSPAKPANASESKVHSSNNGSDRNSHDVEGYSIHIRNLPFDATSQQVEEEFKKFGPIKSDGVQVRNHKVDNFCFGFVEFELPDSMQAAIKASPISFGGCQVFIEEKRTSTRVVNGVVITRNNGRGRFPSRRGGFQNNTYRAHNDNYQGYDEFRGRGGNYASNNSQGYGRMEFRNHGGEYSGHGRGRGPQGHYRAGYQQQRGIQNGNGKLIRPVAMN